MAQYKDGNYIVKDGEIYEVQIDIPRMMGAEVIHIALKDFKKQTNADRIRSMTDEELAERVLVIKATKDYCSGDCNCLVQKDKTCYKCRLEWLRKEAEDGRT